MHRLYLFLFLAVSLLFCSSLFGRYNFRRHG